MCSSYKICTSSYVLSLIVIFTLIKKSGTWLSYIIGLNSLYFIPERLHSAPYQKEYTVCVMQAVITLLLHARRLTLCVCMCLWFSIIHIHVCSVPLHLTIHFLKNAVRDIACRVGFVVGCRNSLVGGSHLCL